MRYYLKSGRRAALMLFRRGSESDYDRAERIDAHNSAIMQAIYAGIMAGEISEAHTIKGSYLDIYTKSLRGDFVQVSHFWKHRGEWVACSHTDAHNVGDLMRDMKTGIYINVQ